MTRYSHVTFEMEIETNSNLHVEKKYAFIHSYSFNVQVDITQL